MGRILFLKGKQKEWLNLVFERKDADTDRIARACGVSCRTIRAWRREEFKISEKALLKISQLFNIPIPSAVKYLPDYWYITKGARKGALKRLELYGPPGTPEGRKRGGQVSQIKRKENPEKYRRMGCIVRKNFPLLNESEKLAEATGIILGDGGVTNYQMEITLGLKTDRQYAKFVQDLFGEVFGERPSWREYNEDNCINLIVSGVNLVESLSKIGIGKGNKIKRQVDFPNWVWKKPAYQIACVRGLVDTDGGLYFHIHWTKGIKYRNLGLCFTSWSKPLLLSVDRVLSKFNVRHYLNSQKRIYVYDLKEVKKFFEIFKPNNPKHIQKLYYHETHSRVLEKKI